jgi:hypothetical protein
MYVGTHEYIIDMFTYMYACLCRCVYVHLLVNAGVYVCVCVCVCVASLKKLYMGVEFQPTQRVLGPSLCVCMYVCMRIYHGL